MTHERKTLTVVRDATLLDAPVDPFARRPPYASSQDAELRIKAVAIHTIDHFAGLPLWRFSMAFALLKTAIAEEAANILRLPSAAVDPLRPLSEMGMDSLMAVELRLALENRLHVDLPLMSLAEGTSVASIATRLANAVAARPQANEVLSLAERYEAADDDRLAAVADADEPFELKSEAAE